MVIPDWVVVYGAMNSGKLERNGGVSETILRANSLHSEMNYYFPYPRVRVGYKLVSVTLWTQE